MSYSPTPWQFDFLIHYKVFFSFENILQVFLCLFVSDILWLFLIAPSFDFDYSSSTFLLWFLHCSMFFLYFFSLWLCSPGTNAAMAHGGNLRSSSQIPKPNLVSMHIPRYSWRYPSKDQVMKISESIWSYWFKIIYGWYLRSIPTSCETQQMSIGWYSPVSSFDDWFKIHKCTLHTIAEHIRCAAIITMADEGVQSHCIMTVSVPL